MIYNPLGFKIFKQEDSDAIDWCISYCTKCSRFIMIPLNAIAKSQIGRLFEKNVLRTYQITNNSCEWCGNKQKIHCIVRGTFEEMEVVANHVYHNQGGQNKLNLPLDKGHNHKYHGVYDFVGNRCTELLSYDEFIKLVSPHITFNELNVAVLDDKYIAQLSPFHMTYVQGSSDQFKINYYGFYSFGEWIKYYNFFECMLYESIWYKEHNVKNRVLITSDPCWYESSCIDDTCIEYNLKWNLEDIERLRDLRTQEYPVKLESLSFPDITSLISDLEMNLAIDEGI